MLWQVFFVVLLIYLAVRRYRNRRIIQVSKKIRCNIKTYPFVGHAYLFLGDSTNRMQSIQLFGRDAINNGGLTKLWLGGQCIVVVVDPVDLEVISKALLEKDDIMLLGRHLIGNGSLIAPVSIWRPRRKVLMPMFALKNMKNAMNIFSRQSSIMVDQLQSVDGKGLFPIWNYLTSYTMDSVCETALGVNVNAQKIIDEPFLKALDKYCNLMATRALQPWLHPDVVYKLLPVYKSLEKCKKIMYSFIDGVINSKRKSLRENNDDTKKNSTHDMKTFLECLIDASGGDQGYTDIELREETLMIVIAANDTSAAGLSFTVAMLARHPDVQELVYKELQEVFGGSERPVKFEDLPHLKYLDAVIRGSLRLYPPAPVVVRKVHKDLKLPSGITLVEGCRVLMHIWGTHRNPRYWGDDAEEFRPERFLHTSLKHPAAFVAFSHGPRNCAGYQYAMMSMKTALATLIRRYRVSNDINRSNGCKQEDKPIRVTFDLMMKDADNFAVQLETRKK